MNTFWDFLFEDPRYAIHRADLPIKVIAISQRKKLNYLGNQLELYLYGHRSVNLIDNRNIDTICVGLADDFHYCATSSIHKPVRIVDVASVDDERDGDGHNLPGDEGHDLTDGHGCDGDGRD